MKLSSGIVVRIDAIYCSSILAEVIEGRPSSIMKWVTLSAPERVIDMWGIRPCHMIPPPALKPDATLKDLPAWIVHVWLMSQPKSPQADFSELVVIFFVRGLFAQPINAVVEEAIRDIEWEELAVDGLL